MRIFNNGRSGVTGLLALALLATMVVAGCAASIPQPGDNAPLFELSDANGQPVALAQLRQDRNAVVLVFYRGFF